MPIQRIDAARLALSFVVGFLCVRSAWAIDPKAAASHQAAQKCLSDLSSKYDGLLKTQRCAIGTLCHKSFDGCDPVANAGVTCGALKQDPELSPGLACKSDYRFNYGGLQEQLPKLVKTLGRTIDREDYWKSEQSSSTTPAPTPAPTPTGGARAASATSDPSGLGMSPPCRAAEGVARAGRMLKGESSWASTQARQMDRNFNTASNAIGDEKSGSCDADLKAYANMDHIALGIEREISTASKCLANVARDIQQKNSCDGALLNADEPADDSEDGAIRSAKSHADKNPASKYDMPKPMKAATYHPPTGETAAEKATDAVIKQAIKDAEKAEEKAEEKGDTVK